MPEPDTTFLERLSAYVDLFRADFGRADRARWAGVYLRGLLAGGPRKNVQSLAASLMLPPDLAVEDTAQALQNFVNQSPWDEGKLLRRYRALVARHLGSGGVFVIQEITFPKKGQYSVGVQRQFSRTLGRKSNCQIAVALYHTGQTGCFPLAVRLYLPQSWLRSPERLEAAGVPAEFRRPAGKERIALELLDEVRAEGLSAEGVVAASGLGERDEFRAGLAERGLPGATGAAEGLAKQACRRLKDELGLEHFEGRSWRGFHHHACLVILAYGFLTLPEAS